jgi:serine/threonine protein kinase
LIQARQVVPPCVTPWAQGTTGPLDIDTNVKSGNRYTTDTDPFPAFTYTSPNLRLSRLASIPIPTTAVVVVAPLTPAGGFHFFDFDLLEVLGMGTFGKVFRVRHKTTGKISALKVIVKAHLTERDEGHVVTELEALQRLVGVKGFLQLEASFHDELNYYILTVCWLRLFSL